MDNPSTPKGKFMGSTGNGKINGGSGGGGGNGILKNVQLAEIFAMDEITHYNRLGSDPLSSAVQNTESLFNESNGGHFTYDFASDDDDDSDILQIGGRGGGGGADNDKSPLPGLSSGNNSSSGYVPFSSSESAEKRKVMQEEDNDSLSATSLPRISSRASSFSNAFVIDVKRTDVLLDSFIFFIMRAEFCLDVTIAVSHYQYGMKWAAGLSWFFIILGAASILHQFNYMEKDQVKALFDRGKRIGILISCFPPLGTILCSYQCMVIGIKSSQDAMISSRYLEIENFSKNLYKRQSFFQAAPQAALQMIIFIESLDTQSVSFGKGVLSLLNILVSLIVMTNSSIPSKAENSRYQIYQSPSQRIFIGIRMFSSFASRIMAITSLFVGLRCLAGFSYGLGGLVIALTILLLPRIIFTFVEFARQLVLARGPATNHFGLPHHQQQQPVAAAPSSGINFSSFQQIFFGYLATILFPVGDPIWVFWYIWTESAVFVLAGNASGWSMACLSNIVNSTYTLIFLVLFIIVPIVVPYVKDSAKRMQIRRIQKLVHESTLDSPSNFS